MKHPIGVIYQPPNRNIDYFLVYLRDIMAKLKNHKKYCHLMGDFNINLLNIPDHTSTANFIDQMYSNAFIPLINKPTRITKKSATLIDNIFTNSISTPNIFKGLLQTDI